MSKLAPIFEMQGISKSFGGLQALLNVNLELYPGEVLALVGDNGAGKSTLIKIATGVYQPDAGEIRLEGRPVALHNPSNAKDLGIRVVHQDLALVDTLSAPENLFLGSELPRSFFGGFVKLLDNCKMRKEAARIIKEKLDMEIPDSDKPVYYRSGGQKQALAIGRALYHSNLKMIILDEPTAALGPEETERTLGLVKTLRDQGLGVILISHNIEEVIGLADRIMVLWRGQRMGTRDPQKTSKAEIIEMIMGSRESVGAAGAVAG